MPPETLEFEAPIVALSFDPYDYHVVYLPTDVQSATPFPDGKPLRIDGEVNGVPHSAALMPHDGRRYLLLSKKLLKRLRCELGDRVHVRYAVADQNAVEVPIELERALEANNRDKAFWEQLTPGRRRGLAYRVASAKRAETRARRVEEVLETLRDT